MRARCAPFRSIVTFGQFGSFASFGSFREKTRSKKLFARASQILPGGVDSPVRAFQAVGGIAAVHHARVGRRHRGRRRQSLHRLRDVVGAADSRPRAAVLVQAIGAAARRGTSFGAPSPLEHELGERVRTLMPSMERVRFVSSAPRRR